MTDHFYAGCPHCAAIFRVPEEKLNLREGLVRCGACREVFNARWNLVENPEAAAPDQPAPVTISSPQGLSNRGDSVEEGGGAPIAQAIGENPFEPDPTPTPTPTTTLAARTTEAPEPLVSPSMDESPEPMAPLSIDEADYQTGSAEIEAGAPFDTRADRDGDETTDSVTTDEALGDRYLDRFTDPLDVESGEPLFSSNLDLSSETEVPDEDGYRRAPVMSAPKEGGGSVNGLDAADDPFIDGLADTSRETGISESSIDIEKERERYGYVLPEHDDDSEISHFSEPVSRPTQPLSQASRITMNGVDDYIKYRPNPLATLAWAAVSLGFVVLLGLQVKVSMVDRYAQDETWRRYLAGFCKIAACELPPRQDPGRFTLTHTKIDLHPLEPGALRVTVKLINQASFAQPYPDLQLTLTDRVGRVVGRRMFSPSVYLDANQTNLLDSGALGSVLFDLAHPHEKAVGFVVDIVTGASST